MVQYAVLKRMLGAAVWITGEEQIVPEVTQFYVLDPTCVEDFRITAAQKPLANALHKGQDHRCAKVSIYVEMFWNTV